MYYVHDVLNNGTEQYEAQCVQTIRWDKNTTT